MVGQSGNHVSAFLVERERPAERVTAPSAAALPVLPEWSPLVEGQIVA